jgi:hypothetical protein
MSTEYFFSSGVFGCTHYPNMKCNGNQKGLDRKNKNPLISKLTAYDSTAKNEYLIGKKLKHLQSKQNSPIVVVESKCKIKKKAVKKITKKYKDCDTIVKKNRSNEYVLFYSKYFQSETAYEYISSDKSMLRVFRVYFFSLKAISLLCENNVIHMDFHFSNLIHDRQNNFHLIDFGLAFDLDNFYKKNDKTRVDKKSLRKVLHTHNPEWLHFPIEIHILSFFVFKGRPLSESRLSSIIDQHYDAIASGSNAFDIIFEDLTVYKYSVYEHYSKKFVNQKPIEEHIMNIVSNASHTWDIYRVARAIFRKLHSIDGGPVIAKLKRLVQDSLHFDYKKRPTADTLINDRFLLHLDKTLKA